MLSKEVDRAIRFEVHHDNVVKSSRLFLKHSEKLIEMLLVLLSVRRIQVVLDGLAKWNVDLKFSYKPYESLIPLNLRRITSDLLLHLRFLRLHLKFGTFRIYFQSLLT